MFDIPDGDLDLLAIGEALVDLISVEETDSLATAKQFRKHQGGSPANLCVNLTKLGCRTGLVARVGQDPFGRFLAQELTQIGISTEGLVWDAETHTSIVFVSHTTGTPDFLACRAADFRLAPADIDPDLIRRARIVHSSMWPLSREPARSAVIRAFDIARERGCLISLDPNYSPHIWPDREAAVAVLAGILPRVSIVKPSLDDARRIFGEGQRVEDYIARFHDLGPRIVVFTMGGAGLLLSEQGDITHIPPSAIDVVDATGAGDAFWAGFLMALLDGHSLKTCAYVAREIAELKLTRVGPLPDHVDREAVYRRAGIASSSSR